MKDEIINEIFYNIDKTVNKYLFQQISFFITSH